MPGSLLSSSETQRGNVDVHLGVFRDGYDLDRDAGDLQLYFVWPLASALIAWTASGRRVSFVCAILAAVTLLVYTVQRGA